MRLGPAPASPGDQKPGPQGEGGRDEELPVAGDLGPAQRERLGRYLLERKRSSDAIAVMELNAEINWNSGWVYASLGDAYREAGDLELALRSYRQALTLDPDNSVLATKIKALIDE